MSENELLIDSPQALRLVMSDDLYLITERNKPESFDYLGDNNKYLLVLHNGPVSATERDFLLQVLKAVQYELKDIALLDYSKYPLTDIQTLKSYFSFARLMSFGVSSRELHIHEAIPAMEHTLYQGTGMIFCPAGLKEISGDRAQKSALWSAMQYLFGLK